MERYNKLKSPHPKGMHPECLEFHHCVCAFWSIGTFTINMLRTGLYSKYKFHSRNTLLYVQSLKVILHNDLHNSVHKTFPDGSISQPVEWWCSILDFACLGLEMLNLQQSGRGEKAKGTFLKASKYYSVTIKVIASWPNHILHYPEIPCRHTVSASKSSPQVKGPWKLLSQCWLCAFPLLKFLPVPLEVFKL